MKRNLIVALLAGLLLVAPSARAADPAFVGVLALAVEEQVAKELGLSDEVRKQLDELIQAREDEILNLGLRELSDDEQKAKLAAFAAESEKQGLALLSKEQQTKLMQIGVARRGLSTLADAKVAQAIGLDEKQRSNITKMLDGLKGKLAAGTETERKIAKAEAERGLNLILTKEQRAAWDKLAGLGGGGEEKPAEAVAKGDDEQPADEKPAATKPEATRPGSRKPDDKKPELSKPQPPKNIDDVRLRMNFSYTPWKAVLEWLAEEADLSLVGDTMPPGTCNYKDSRSYTVSQAIDILNGQLQLRGFTVVRRERMLFVWDMENGTVPAHIAPLVTPAELDKRGEFELLTCVFSFSKLTPEEVEGDIRKLIGPGGSMTVLSKLKRLSVTETGGKLRSIRDIIKEADAPASLESSEPLEQTHPVVYPIAIADPESVLQVLQTLLAGQANLRISKDPKTGNIVANGTPAQHASIKALIDEMQQDKRSFTVIKLKKLDPELVVADLKSLFGIVEGQTNTNHPKLIANPTMKYIGVFGSKQQIEQIRTAVIEMGESPAGSNDSMPTVRSYSREIPLTGRSLNAALEQFQAIAPVYLTNEIRVVKSPAVTDGVGEIPSRVPVPKEWEKKAARPAANTNSASSPPRGDDEDRGYRGFGRGGFGGFGRGDFRGGGDYRGRGDDRGSEERRPEGERPQGEDRRSQRLKPAQYYYVAWQDPESTEEESEPKEPARQNVPLVSEESASKEPAEEEPAEKPATPSGRKSAAPPPQKTTPGAEVVITITPNGIVVSSQDLDALDKVEEMLSQFVNEDPGKEYTIFKLRYARADVAAELLGQALGGGSSDDSGGGSPLGDIAGQMFGGGGMGGIMGAMLGGGGGGSSVISSGPVLLIPDNRLNVILAQGKPGDLDIAEMLLKIIDLPDSGVSVEVVAKPRFIPVLHTTAAEMAETIKQVYANRMVTPPGQPQQVSPQQLMQALAGGGRRGGRGGGAGGGNDRKSEEQKMSIGVDEKSNSLIVSAPPALFDEIAQLVEELDIATSQKDEFVWIGNSATNAALIEQSLASILGDDVEITRVGTTTTTPGRGTQRNNNTSRTANNQNQRQPGNQQFSPQQIQTFMQGQGRGGGGGGFPGGGGFQGGGGGPGGGGGQGQGRGGGGGGRNR